MKHYVVIDPNYKDGKNELIYHQHIDHTETVEDYRMAIDTIISAGYAIQAVIIDGRRGVRQIVESYHIPVQYCQFHQLLTITQCLTRHPKLLANQELRAIALTLTKTNRATLEAQLDNLVQEIWIMA